MTEPAPKLLTSDSVTIDEHMVWLTVMAGSAIYYLGRLILGIIGLLS